MTLAFFRRGMAWCCAGLVAVLLSACASPPKIGQHAIDGVFERTGRFALSVTHTGGRQEAVQGGFAWHDSGRELTLDLANPLGSTLARVQVLPGQSVLTRANGSTERAQHPDALVELVLGSPIPVAGLRDWLQGQTGSAAVTNLEKDSDGKISAFSQQGWRVQLSRYDAAGPALLQMNRHDATRTISVRLVVDSR